jgi:hypothetical protein
VDTIQLATSQGHTDATLGNIWTWSMAELSQAQAKQYVEVKEKNLVKYIKHNKKTVFKL